ncbi:hypothetical protein LTR56_006177 [Elasticomyces elasticus]|nr:hypothetical protein LTR56_006177 [Elasticomyces elasticus]KAK3666613.1 hypothetical protein LTR22_002557 [Elasticomyces elasticus]KAK4928253.1 hypothetical protein LTR49_004930 [Elasticomyces elasticus]KAK5763816.1 hypothetical protein LTS12_005934 [Elasticomyces elasticus]
MEGDYYTEKAYYLSFLDHDITGRSGEKESLRTTPLFSLAVKHAVDKTFQKQRAEIPEASKAVSGEAIDSASESEDGGSIVPVNLKARYPGRTLPMPILPQYGLLGFHVGKHDRISHHEPIMMNVHAPNSAFICGSQGSGKSYTLNCFLENCLLADACTGKLLQPLAGLLFHYDIDSSGMVAETASLCSRGIRVNVLVSSSNLEAAQRNYRAVTNKSEYLTVEKFLLSPSDLSIERMHKLMAFSDRSDAVPLYMEVIQRILRQMAILGHGRGFNYGEFLQLLDQAGLSPEQQRPMRLRLDLLHSFMRWPPSKTDLKRKLARKLLDLQPGTLTIVDLSDPFVDTATVCTLFDICLSVAKEKRPECGMVVALDEAHKYIDQSPAATNFTNRVLTTIREQRHIGTRVVISTQEPTISEQLLDLCSISIVHHFKSPKWFRSIRDHLGGASGLINSEKDQARLFEEILMLPVGESRVFVPSAFVCLSTDGQPKKLGSDVLRMRTRSRLGTDAGVSLLAGEKYGGSSR